MAKLHSYRKPDIEMNDRDYWYIVGFGLGDGCISSNGREFAMASTDKQIIEDIANVTGLTVRAQPYGDKGMVCYKTSICRRVFVDKLMELGFPKNKSHTDGWLVVPKEGMEAHFLRGFMDTDGCVSSDKKRGKLKSNFLSSSKRMLEWIQSYMSERGCIGSIRDRGSIWTLSYGKFDTQILVSFLYDTEGLVNNRKRDKALALCEEFPVRNGSGKRKRSGYVGLNLPTTVQEMEDRCLGARNKTEMAQMLGVERRVFYNWIRTQPDIKKWIDRGV